MPIRCGAAAVDITPDKFVGMAGYSLAGKIATGVSGRLHARALYIEDGDGREATLCVIDLMSASRLLLDRATSLTGGVFSSSQVLLAGTHTHTGPGRFYGNKFYDRFAQAGTLLSLDPFDEEIASFIARGIATALLNARRTAVNALIGFGVEEVWGIARNRSHVAFLENPESTAWKGIHPPPRTLSPDQLAVDPRVSSLVAVTDATRELIGVFALYSCHATALGPKADTYDPDWPGVAVDAARRQLGDTGVIAIATSAAADQSPTRSDRPQGLELARFVGNAVGDAVAKATIRGIQNATTVTVHSVFTEFDPITEREVDGRPETRLSEKWAIGAPTLAGGVDGRSSLHPAFAFDGMPGTDFDPVEPQFPKSLAFGEVQTLLKSLLRLEQAKTLPLQAFRIGQQSFVTVPGECSVVLGHRIETAARTAAGGAVDLRIVCYAGDYSGYYTTHEEYMAQFYEGASMIYGRFASAHLLARIETLVKTLPIA